MAFQLEVEKFLEPIAGSNPSGKDLRYSAVYDKIKEAKRADDQLDRGEWHTELKRSNWPLVIKLCSQVLIEKSKDLQIAVWFTEALLHHHGFAGLRFGLELLFKLLKDFWDTLYPEVEDDDLDFRVGPLTYLNEKLPMSVQQVPLCDPGVTKGYDYFAWEDSRLVGFEAGLTREQKDRRQEMIEEGKISAEDFRIAVNKSSIGFYKDMHEQLSDCRTLLKNLDELTSQQFADDPPGFAQLDNAVKASLRVVHKIYSEKRKSEVVETDDEDFSPGPEPNIQDAPFGEKEMGSQMDEVNLCLKQNVITDITDDEKRLWKTVVYKAGNGQLKNALDQLMAAAALAPSERQKNRYLLLVAKLCINAGRHDLARPVVEQLYELIETLNLDKWEHPVWIADVIEALYRCLQSESDGPNDRASQLFQKLCTLNITKAATFRNADVQ